MPCLGKNKIYRLLLLLLLASCIVDAKKVKVKEVKGNKKKLDVDELGPSDQSIGDIEEIEINVKVGGPFKKIKKLPGSRGVGNHWAGEGEKGEAMNLVRSKGRKGRHDILVGSFVDPTENVVHQIRQDANGDTFMFSKPTEDFPPDKYVSVDGERALLENLRTDKGSLRGAHALNRRLQSKPVIRMLVVWTQEAECMQSSLPSGCTVTDTTHANMEALAELAVAETNTAYDLSGVDAELQLAFAYRDPDNYVEYATATDDAFENALRDLRQDSPADTFLNDVHTKRTEYGADAVVLMIADSAFCGLGYVNTSPQAGYMFSVNDWGCSTGYYSFGHELGHNMGCYHDRGTENQCDTATHTNSYYGFRDTGGAFRSIMAYNCNTTQCDSNPSNSCTRVQRFSHPGNYIVGGVSQGAIGDSNNDCAAQLSAVAETVSNFYATPTCGNGDVDAGEDCDLVNLNEQSCESLGLTSGILQCDRDCNFDTSLCSGNVPSGPTDILFIVDTTGSYHEDLPVFQEEAPTIMENIQAVNADTRFALVRFQDFPVSPFGAPGDVPYERVVDFTDDPEVMSSAIAGLVATGGADGPESQLEAIWQSISGPNKVSFRTEASKFIMLWTDSRFHRPEVESPPYPVEAHTTQQVLDALTALQSTRRHLIDIHIPPINPPSPPPPIWPLNFIGISRNDNADVLGDLAGIASHVGTVGPFDCDGDGVDEIGAGEPVACPSVTSEGLGESITTIIEETIESYTPEALCVDAVETTTDDGECHATVDIDDGSSDPGDLPIALYQPSKFPLGFNSATLVVTNSYGYSGHCDTTVTVTDDEQPELDCNIPDDGIGPNDAPVTIQMLATDNCGVVTRNVDNLSCFKEKKKGGKQQVKCNSFVEESPDGILYIRNTGGVGTHISWKIHAVDTSLNSASKDCELVIRRPNA